MSENPKIVKWVVEPTSKYWSSLGDSDTSYLTMSTKIEDYFCFIEEHVFTNGETEYVTRCNAEIDSTGWCMASASHPTLEAALSQILEFIEADKFRRASEGRLQVNWTKEEIEERVTFIMHKLMDARNKIRREDNLSFKRHGI